MSEKSKPPIFTKEKADILRRTLGKFDENITDDPLALEDSIIKASSSKDCTFLLHVLIETLCIILEVDEYKRKELFNRLFKGFEENKVIHSVINVDNLARARRDMALKFYEHIKQVHKGISPLSIELSYEISDPSIHISRIEKYNEAFDEISVIAKGGFGTVCMARHKVDGAIYAVKKIIFDYRSDSDYVKVMREVRNLSSLSNKYVVAYNNAWVQPVPPSEMNFEELDSESDSFDQSTEDASVTNDQSAENSVSFQEHLRKADSNDESSSIIFQDDANESQSSFSVKSDYKRVSSDSETSSIIFSTDAQYSLNEKYNTESKREYCGGDSSLFQNPVESQSSFNAMCTAESKRISIDSEYSGIMFQVDPIESQSNLSTNQSESSCALKNKKSQSKGPHFSMLRIKMMLCIQMEYCDCDLRHWLEARNEGRPLPFSKSIPDIFKEILCGVAYIHEKEIIHRDLKPQNIFFSKEKGVVKVGDLGLATINPTYSEVEQGSSKHSTNLGTLPYAAPEQRSNSVYDSKVDMYSLGIILIELLVKIGTKMELCRVIEDFKRGIIPEEIKQSWPDYIPLLNNLLQEDNTYRMNAKQVLDMPLFKDKNVEESDLEQKLKDMEIVLANKEMEFHKREKTLKQKLLEQEQAFQQRLEEQKRAMEQEFQEKKRELEEALISKEHIFQQISEEVKLLKDYMDSLH